MAAATGGATEFEEYLRLWVAATNPEKKRPVGRPRSWTDDDFRAWLALIEGQRRTMRLSGNKGTAKEAITRLLALLAARFGVANYRAMRRINYLQKKLSSARQKFPKLTGNSP